MNLKIACLILLTIFAAVSTSLTTLLMTNIEEEPQSVSFTVIPRFRPAGDPIDDPYPTPKGNSTSGP